MRCWQYVCVYVVWQHYACGFINFIATIAANSQYFLFSARVSYHFVVATPSVYARHHTIVLYVKYNS